MQIKFFNKRFQKKKIFTKQDFINQQKVKVKQRGFLRGIFHFYFYPKFLLALIYIFIK